MLGRVHPAAGFRGRDRRRPERPDGESIERLDWASALRITELPTPVEAAWHPGWQPARGAPPKRVGFRRFSVEPPGPATSSVGCTHSRRHPMAKDENGQSARGKPSEDYTGQAAGWNELAEKLSQLARAMHEEKDLKDTLDALVLAAADTVPGADEASISAVSRRRAVQTTAATGALSRAVDQAQYETGQGPCLDSLYDQQTLRLSDTCREPRWPAFCARASQLGVRSMLAIQLYVENDNLGALNLHSRQVDAFSDESEQVALMFAAHAAIAVAGAQAQEQMQTAVDSRDLIGQAKGILIERYKISSHEAFRLLVVASQTTNVKLYDVADFLVRTGALASRKL